MNINEQINKTMLDFAGFCFIHNPELSNEINTLIAKYLNTIENNIPQEKLNKKQLLLDFRTWWYGNRRSATEITSEEINEFLGE